MTIGELDLVIEDDNNIEIVDKYIFLGVLITNDVITDKELRRRLEMGKCAMGSLKGRYIQRQRHQTNDQHSDCLNTCISNYPVCSRNLDYQKGRVGQSYAFELWC